MSERWTLFDLQRDAGGGRLYVYDTYTGLRRWNFNAVGTATLAYSYGNVSGRYNSYGGTMTISRQLWRTIHFATHFSAMLYASGSFAAYNRRVYGTRVGFGWSLKDIPLRIW